MQAFGFISRDISAILTLLTHSSFNVHVSNNHTRKLSRWIFILTPPFFICNLQESILYVRFLTLFGLLSEMRDEVESTHLLLRLFSACWCSTFKKRPYILFIIISSPWRSLDHHTPPCTLITSSPPPNFTAPPPPPLFYRTCGWTLTFGLLSTSDHSLRFAASQRSLLWIPVHITDSFLGDLVVFTSESPLSPVTFLYSHRCKRAVAISRKWENETESFYYVDVKWRTFKYQLEEEKFLHEQKQVNYVY